MAATVLLKALGLNLSSNDLLKQEGQLSTASNVIIRRDNVIEPRRGFKLYGNQVGTSTDRAKQLFSYQNRLLRHYQATLEYDTGEVNSDGEEVFTPFAGSYSEPTPGRRIQSVVSNGNLYFPTSEGVKKITAESATDFSQTSVSASAVLFSGSNVLNGLSASAIASIATGYIVEGTGIPLNTTVISIGTTTVTLSQNVTTSTTETVTFSPNLISNAGGVKALNINSAYLEYTQGQEDGFFIEDSTTAYRVVWGVRDVNNNLILGAPSERVIISNPLLNLLILDFNTLLARLDDLNQSGSKVTNGNYASVGTTAVVTPTGNTSSGSTSIGTVSSTAGIVPGATITGTGIASGAKVLSISGSTVIMTQKASANGIGVTLTFTPPSDLKLASDATASDLRTALINLTTRLDQNLQLASPSGTGVPLTMAAGAAVATASIRSCTVTFSSGNPSSYISVGDVVNLTGFTMPTGTIDGPQTVLAVTSTTISFEPVDSTANGNSTAAGIIESYNYRNITVPNAIVSDVTHGDLINLQTYWESIVLRLNSELTSVISSTLKSNYLNLSSTTAATVLLSFNIPQDVIYNYHFYQIYRSRVFAASSSTDVLADIIPDDEMRLVYEGYPTQTQFNSKQVSIEDVTPDTLAGAYLYSNETTGEGNDQINDIPPFCHDINRFKNYIFFSNTRTRQRLSITLLGVSNLSSTTKLTISDGTTTNTYNFVLGVEQARTITCGTAANLTDSGYFDLTSSLDRNKYYVWFDKTGSSTDPALSGRTGIRVNLSEYIPGTTTAITAGTSSDIARKLCSVLSAYPVDFTVSVSSNVVTITNTLAGRVTASDVTTNSGFGTGWSASITAAGNGENVASKNILISDVISPSQAVDETARSIVNVINQTSGDIVYAYYVTGTQLVAGTIVLEAKQLSTDSFYVMANEVAAGQSFVPDISPTNIGITSTIANPTVVTLAGHGFKNLDQVIISGSDSTPSIDGLYAITYLSANTFSIPINVSAAATKGAIRAASAAQVSNNEEKINRIYYSKYSQPDAVPILNYYDVGAENKAILRIFPLRDTLFVFKEDGVFRISGQYPFTTSLFDSSYVLVAPDSLSVANNVLYGFTAQGIMTMSEAGSSIVSRDIDTAILKLKSAAYTNFKTATWGTGYDSDNAYFMFTVNATSDEVATICYRYSNLTQTWTTFDKSNTCGVVNPVNDRLYLGAGDTNYLEEERKSFDRTDYADREFIVNLEAGNYLQSGTVIQLSDVSDIDAGDVLYQNQKLTVYAYNALLNKLDIDPAPTAGDYFTTLEAVAGDNLRTKLEALAAKLDADPGVAFTTFSSAIASKSATVLASAQSIADPTVITSAGHGLVTGRLINIVNNDATPDCDGEWVVTVINSNTFSIDVNVVAQGATSFSYQTIDDDVRDIEACFNAIITLLNTDTQLGFNNYQSISLDTPQETIITDVNTATKQITVATAMPFVQGELTVFKAIATQFQYAPLHFGDPLGLKHLRESTVMFEAMDFTSATVAFATDLLPSFTEVDITGQGNGIYGSGTGDYGDGYYGGAGNSAPFRTYIPRNAQRCRLLLIRFTHQVAREKYSIFGVTITGKAGQSSRAYR